MPTASKGNGTKEHPWLLKTPPGISEFEAYRDASSTPAALVVQVGKTQLKYDLRCIDDMHSIVLNVSIRLQCAFLRPW